MITHPTRMAAGIGQNSTLAYLYLIDPWCNGWRQHCDRCLYHSVPPEVTTMYHPKCAN